MFYALCYPGKLQTHTDLQTESQETATAFVRDGIRNGARGGYVSRGSIAYEPDVVFASFVDSNGKSHEYDGSHPLSEKYPLGFQISGGPDAKNYRGYSLWSDGILQKWSWNGCYQEDLKAGKAYEYRVDGRVLPLDAM